MWYYLDKLQPEVAYLRMNALSMIKITEIEPITERRPYSKIKAVPIDRIKIYKQYFNLFKLLFIKKFTQIFNKNV